MSFTLPVAEEYIVEDRDVLVRKIKIKDLPEAEQFNRRIDLEELALDENSEVIFVAKEGYVHDWAAYSGWPFPVKAECVSDYYAVISLDWERVMQEGDKLYPNNAKLFFPEFADKAYRS